MKFYQKTWFIIVTLILFAPVGIFLMWKYRKFNKPARITLSLVSGLFFIMILNPNNSTNTNSKVEKEQTKQVSKEVAKPTEVSKQEPKEATKTTERDSKTSKEEKTPVEQKAPAKEQPKVNSESKVNIEDKINIKAEPNTSAAVDELILKGKADSKVATQAQLKEASKFIATNYPNYFKDNKTMHKMMYYGSLLEYSNQGKDIINLGMDSEQVVKYVYRKVEKLEDQSTQSNLQQIKKSLNKISSDWK